MSDVADRARVTVLLSDYAVTDAVGKINALGVGWAVTGTDANTGLSAPQTVIIIIDAPPDLYGEEFAVTLTLRDADDAPVTLPGPTGEPEAMRIAQTLRVDEPSFDPALNVPRGVVWGHTQVVVNFGAGLPLSVGKLYTWSLDIDGQRDPRWAASFYVPGPRPGPVFGGPANPASISDLGDSEIG